MGKAWKVFIAVLAVGMLFFALGCDGGYEGCGGVDPDPGDGEPPQLTMSHSGWKVANCTACHNSSHTAGMNPYECASCHGDNGATTFHNANRDCSSCHGTRIRPTNHPAASFPFGECGECHQR